MKTSKKCLTLAISLILAACTACGGLSSTGGDGGYDCTTLAGGCDEYDRRNASYDSPAVNDFVDSVQADRDARLGD